MHQRVLHRTDARAKMLVDPSWQPPSPFWNSGHIALPRGDNTRSLRVSDAVALWGQMG